MWSIDELGLNSGTRGWDLTETRALLQLFGGQFEISRIISSTIESILLRFDMEVVSVVLEVNSCWFLLEGFSSWFGG